jgi:transposase
MDNLSHGRVIGIDVSRDWLDVHCLPDGHCCKLPNAPAGHASVADLARDRDAVVRFESTAGQEWQLWTLLETKGVAARQRPPAQVKAFAQSRGTRAKTDRIDAELIARFFVFRPEASRSLPAEKLRLIRALTTKRAQLVEMRKRLLAQIRAHQKLGTAVMFEDVDTELKQRIDSLIKELEYRITRAIANDERLSETAGVLRSIPGIGPVASSMLVAEMPEICTITGEEAAALTGLAPVAHDSGTLPGKRAIAGGRRALRHVMFQAALVAAHHNPSLQSFADRLRKAGKPHKGIITAVARKLVTIGNALCKNRQKWLTTDP